ncbi:6134_t:CDS:2 [Funneliformis mosseae]|uniref:rRNA-processing protein EFG1 n=1 Tax=Funneliformis mosseae TaxID=27381 RepID=A0A9N9HR85_FUNMO|nr:6134_t:CDS:2 [Funneliformis mosseae]
MALARKNNSKKSEIMSLDTMSVTALKKKLRDIERYLKTNEKLSAKGQVSLERQLKACKLTLIERMAENKEKDMAAKYRMVKHFDRRKVERAIKQTQKKLSEVQSLQEKANVENILYELQIDLNYILYYPKHRKYLALHPSNGGDDEEMVSKRNEIRQVIKEAVQNNDLESLNNRFRNENKLQVIKKMDNIEKRKNNLKGKVAVESNTSKTNKSFDDDFFGSEEEDMNNDNNDTEV